LAEKRGQLEQNQGSEMVDRNRRPLAGRDGPLGWLDLTEQPANNQEALVRLENGTAVRVPADLLIEQPDGSFYLPMSRTQFLSHDTPQAGRDQESIIVIPVIAEEIEVSKREFTSGRVQIYKHVHEHEETVDVPVMHEEVQIERVPVDRFVDAPPQVRYEGDTMVIPVLEEVLVVEKQLRLKEEVRVTMIQKEVRESTQVTLREEDVEVNRVDTGKQNKKEF
jgi:uncharacterized protein (TIGR02271 family)